MNFIQCETIKNLKIKPNNVHCSCNNNHECAIVEMYFFFLPLQIIFQGNPGHEFQQFIISQNKKSRKRTKKVNSKQMHVHNKNM